MPNINIPCLLLDPYIKSILMLKGFITIFCFSEQNNIQNFLGLFMTIEFYFLVVHYLDDTV